MMNSEQNTVEYTFFHFSNNFNSKQEHTMKFIFNYTFITQFT
jgi:hypothetical protein